MVLLFYSSQIVSVHQHIVKPDCNDYVENVLSEECRLLAGLDVEQVKSAQALDQVLDEVRVFPPNYFNICSAT